MIYELWHIDETKLVDGSLIETNSYTLIDENQIDDFVMSMAEKEENENHKVNCTFIEKFSLDELKDIRGLIEVIVITNLQEQLDDIKNRGMMN